jgi:hypothetical protein
MTAVRDGPQTLRIDLRVIMDERSGNAPASTPLATRTDVLAATVQLVPDRDTVELVSDATLRAKVQEGLLLLDGSSLTARRAVYANGQRIYFEFEAAGPPVGLAFDVFIRDSAGREWQVGSIDFAPGKTGTSIVSGKVPGFAASVVDVVLRSSARAARETTYLTRIWDGELVFEKIPVLWKPGTSRPVKGSRWAEPPGAATTATTATTEK